MQTKNHNYSNIKKQNGRSTIFKCKLWHSYLFLKTACVCGGELALPADEKVARCRVAGALVAPLGHRGEATHLLINT